MDAIAFNLADKIDIVKSGRPFDIVYTIDQNKHRSALPGAFQLLIKDLRPSQ